MALRELNETFVELRKDMNHLRSLKDGLLMVYDLLNKPLPDDVVHIIQSATKESEEWSEGRERFVNRVANFKDQMIHIGFGEEMANAVVKDFTEFLRKN